MCPASGCRSPAATGDQWPALARLNKSSKLGLQPLLPLFSPPMKQKAYARAGVDIDLGNKVKSTLPRLLAATHRPEVLGKVGGFGGLFALDTRKYREPVLVSSVDGVGTKLKLAFALDRHDTIGQDLVNHCVNDIAVLGAEPLFFLDYIGTGKLAAPRLRADHPRLCQSLRRESLRPDRRRDRPNARLLPAGRIRPQRHDCRRGGEGRDAGRQGIRPGDAVIGLASSGLHTNGYSLARKIFFERMKLKPGSYVPDLRNTIGDELLKVHRQLRPADPEAAARSSRGQASRLSRKPAPNCSGQAGRLSYYQRHRPHHGRRLCGQHPPRAAAQLRRHYPQRLLGHAPIFQLIQAKGGVEEAELYQVFNMGIGMVLIVAADKADAIVAFIRAQQQRCW